MILIRNFYIMFILTISVYGAIGPSAANGQTVKAFPTAEGFGADATGGREGRIIEVTNLNDAGPGSFREAVTATGARIVVFKVSGTITLESVINIREPYLTIAGQTSPGGVQFKTTPGIPTGIHVLSGAHNVIIRHLRVRTGGPAERNKGESLIVFGNGSGATVHDVIFDHVSLEWGSEAQFMAYSNVDNVTLQWSIIAEGAADGEGSGHKGSHIGWGESIRYTDHHNLYASNGQRSPLIQRAGVFDFRNNVVYNWGGNRGGDFGQFNLNHSVFGNIVNNHYIPGPNSRAPSFFVNNGGPTRVDGTSADRGGTKIYTSGNWGWHCPTGCTDDWKGFYTSDYWRIDKTLPPADPDVFRADNPFSVAAVTTDPTPILKDKMLATVGAYKPFRDSLDARIINDVKNGTGNISTIGYGGPWPNLAGSAPPADTDRDGMPDEWEQKHGLDSSNGQDGSWIASNGYTNVENYLNELAGDLIVEEETPPATPQNVRILQ